MFSMYEMLLLLCCRGSLWMVGRRAGNGRQRGEAA